MSTRPLTHDEAMRELVTPTRKRLIGQDAAVTAFAAEICRHTALSPLQRRPGIFLVAGPNVDDDHLGLPLGLAATFSKTGGLYELASSHGEDLVHLVAPVIGGTEVHSLLHSVKDNPNALFVLQDIDKAQPGILKTLMIAWSQGFVDDEAGEKISLAEATFVLTTEVAQEAIGQIARSEPDPDRLHVACLKLLVDAGFPASLLESIDTAFALKNSYRGRGRPGALRQLCRAGRLAWPGSGGRRTRWSDPGSFHGLIERAHFADALLPRDKLDIAVGAGQSRGHSHGPAGVGRGDHPHFADGRDICGGGDGQASALSDVSADEEATDE